VIAQMNKIEGVRQRYEALCSFKNWKTKHDAIPYLEKTME
jgi:hypothetical protein